MSSLLGSAGSDLALPSAPESPLARASLVVPNGRRRRHKYRREWRASRQWPWPSRTSAECPSLRAPLECRVSRPTIPPEGGRYRPDVGWLQAQLYAVRMRVLRRRPASFWRDVRGGLRRLTDRCRAATRGCVGGAACDTPMSPERQRHGRWVIIDEFEPRGLARVVGQTVNTPPMTDQSDEEMRNAS